MQILGEQVGHGVREQRVDIRRHGAPVPTVVWRPDDRPARGLVLMGHGWSLDKRTPYLLSLGRRLVRHHDIAAVAIDAPGHGDRPPTDGLDASLGDAAIDGMVADWTAVLDLLLGDDHLGEVPVGYWGLSLGTILGLPFVAAEARVRAAVLGLAPIGGPWAARHQADAPRVRIPVVFLRQLDDELFAPEAVEALYAALGTERKEMRSNPGPHAAVPPDEFARTETFLADALLGTSLA